MLLASLKIVLNVKRLLVAGVQLVSGNSNRVVLKVSLQLEKLEARMQYESNTAPPLGLLSVEAVAVDVTLRPDTLNATASLGNLKAQDGALHEVCDANVLACQLQVPLFCLLQRCGAAVASALCLSMALYVTLSDTL